MKATFSKSERGKRDFWGAARTVGIVAGVAGLVVLVARTDPVGGMRRRRMRVVEGDNMRQKIAGFAVGCVLLSGRPIVAQEEVDVARLQRDVGRVLSDYQRGLGPRAGSLHQDGIALGILREGINRVSSFQRETSLEAARNKTAEARSYLERQGPLSDPASRALGRVDDILKPPVASEPAEKTKARLLAALEPFQTDLLQRAMVLTAIRRTVVYLVQFVLSGPSRVGGDRVRQPARRGVSPSSSQRARTRRAASGVVDAAERTRSRVRERSLAFEVGARLRFCSRRSPGTFPSGTKRRG